MKHMKDMSREELIFIGHRINRLQKQAEELLPTTMGLDAANLGIAIVRCRLYREALKKEYNNRK